VILEIFTRIMVLMYKNYIIENNKKLSHALNEMLQLIIHKLII